MPRVSDRAFTRGSMSEYQYYEWQTIDHPLTAKEQSAVNQLSSHMDTVTSTQAVVTYSWATLNTIPKKCC